MFSSLILFTTVQSESIAGFWLPVSSYPPMTAASVNCILPTPAFFQSWITYRLSPLP